MSHVRCLFSHLVERCEERGYDINTAMACVLRIEAEGKYVVVDTEHMAYPIAGRTPEEIIEHAKQIQDYWANHKPVISNPLTHSRPLGYGPGTELKKMLAKIGIKASPTCSCNSRAQVMDSQGVQWCKDNVDTIVGWLREEATKRGLPFVDLAGKIIVKRAISLAEKAEKQRQQAKEANSAPNG